MSFRRFFYNGDRPVREQRKTEICQRIVTIAMAAGIVAVWFVAVKPLSAILTPIPAYASLLWDIGRIGARIKNAGSRQLLGCGIADTVLTAGALLVMALTIIANNVIRSDVIDTASYVQSGNLLPAVPFSVSLTLVHLMMAITAFINRKEDRRTVQAKGFAPSIDNMPLNNVSA